jgi:actin-related protein 2
MAAECLFQPHLIGLEARGMSELIFDCERHTASRPLVAWATQMGCQADGVGAVFAGINGSDINLRVNLYKHIVLSGGSTMYPGLPSRLERDIKRMYTENVAGGDATRLSKYHLSSCCLIDSPRSSRLVMKKHLRRR